MVTKPTIWPNGRFGVPQITPYTYRDGHTLLELITSLRDHVVEQLHPNLQKAIDQLVADVETEYGKALDQYVNGVQEFQRIHDAFMSDVNARLTALNDGAVSDLVEDDTSLLGQILRRTFEPHGEVHRNTYDRMGVVVVHGELTIERLQAAADEAAETGKRLWAAGELETSETLLLRCSMDLENLTIRYTGNTAAVEVGIPGESTSDIHGTLPSVVTGTLSDEEREWANLHSGIKLVNLNSSSLTVPLVRGFHVGLDCVGDGYGFSYNTITIGHLSANKINQRLVGINKGWANQNTFLGGRFSHWSNMWREIEDCRHILLAQSANIVNNNTWLNPSIEGEAPEYHIECAGMYNMFIQPRFEAINVAPKVFWSGGAQRNQIFHGFYTQSIEETWSDNALISNTVVSSTTQNIKNSGRLPNQVIHNSYTVDAMFQAMVGWTGDRPQMNPLEDYNILNSGNGTKLKRTNDEHPRVNVNGYNGTILFGPGTREPDSGIGVGSTGILRLITATSQNPNLWSSNGRATPDKPVGYLRVQISGGNYYIPYYTGAEG